MEYYKTQQELIKTHLEEHGFIDTMTAIKLYSVTRISAVIFELRKTMKIKDVRVKGLNKFGKKVSYNRYYIVSMGRKAIGVELKESYFKQAIRNLKTVEERFDKNETLFG